MLKDQGDSHVRQRAQAAMYVLVAKTFLAALDDHYQRHQLFMTLLACRDHGRGVPGGCHQNRKRSLPFLPQGL